MASAGIDEGFREIGCTANRLVCEKRPARTGGDCAVQKRSRGTKARQTQAFVGQPGGLAKRPDCLAGAGGIEPPHGGIKISLFRQRYQRAF